MTTERVRFRLIVTPCCTSALCYVNPRLPNFCSECGANIMAQVKSCVTLSDEFAILKVKEDGMALTRRTERLERGSAVYPATSGSGRPAKPPKR